jgi:hypothetical protein
MGYHKNLTNELTHSRKEKQDRYVINEQERLMKKRKREKKGEVEAKLRKVTYFS